jgi:hypothetical protein
LLAEYNYAEKSDFAQKAIANQSLLAFSFRLSALIQRRRHRVFSAESYAKLNFCIPAVNT